MTGTLWIVGEVRGLNRILWLTGLKAVIFRLASSVLILLTVREVTLSVAVEMGGVKVLLLACGFTSETVRTSSEV